MELLTTEMIPWLVFGVTVLVALFIDLMVVGRNSHVVEKKEAAIWTIIWISLALIFNVFVYFWLGPDKALEYLTGYIIEKSLSVDNIFVFIVIFSYFGVKKELHHRVLFWGILGALIMRAIMIALGVTLIHNFEWVVYIFGFFLLYTAYKIAKEDEVSVHPENNPIVKQVKKIFPITKDFEGSKFFVRHKGKLHATPLFVALIVIESSDLAFAVDSIPAILAITPDPFIVYTSNIFAILGLRALYFVVSGVLEMFKYLKYGLASVLGFIGVKMLISHFYHVDTVVSLAVVATLLSASIIASVIKK